MRLSGIIESAFYYPSRETFVTPRSCEDVWINTPDGKRLHAWFMRAADAAPGEARPAILHCHGNAGNVESHADFSRFLTNTGMHVLVFDYRGYGRSDAARPLNRRALLIDSLAAFDTLAARPDVDPNRIGVYGVSLGAVFALAVAEQRPSVACACTVAAFSSWKGVAADHVPVLPHLLLAGGLDPRSLVPALADRPFLIVHGTADEIINARHAAMLEQAAKDAGVPVHLVRITDADHNGIMNHQHSRDVVSEFFRRSLQAPTRTP